MTLDRSTGPLCWAFALTDPRAALLGVRSNRSTGPLCWAFALADPRTRSARRHSDRCTTSALRGASLTDARPPLCGTPALTDARPPLCGRRSDRPTDPLCGAAAADTDSHGPIMRWTPPADGIDVPRLKSQSNHEHGRRPRCRLPRSASISRRTCSSARRRSARQGGAQEAAGARQLSPFFANLPRCVVGLEAVRRAHHWARELIRLGHDARLMPPQYVKAYVKTNMHDAADAEACFEAVQRPRMRFVPVKSEATAIDVYAASGARSADRSAHRDDQRAARASCRTRDRRGTAPGRPAPAAGGARRSRGRRAFRRSPGRCSQTLVAHLRDLAAKLPELDRRLVALTLMRLDLPNAG